MRPLLTVALAVAVAACKKAPAPVPSPATEVKAVLSAPDNLTGRALGPDTTGYSNEDQAANLREQASALGIRKLSRPSEQSDPEETRPTISYEEGLERTREYSREFEAQRHAIDKDKKKTVALPGGVPSILPGKKEGVPLDPEPDATTNQAPKGPETK